VSDRLSPIAAARNRHSLAEVAGRSGIWIPATVGTVTVRCPMPAHGHRDRTPSLRLYLDDGMWYCFACSHHAGDVVQWVQETEGVPWRQAIEILDSGRSLTNAWAGVPGDYGSQRGPTIAGDIERPSLNRTSAARVQEVLDAAWEHVTCGPLHARAVAYLASRGINVTVLESCTGRLEAGHTPTYGPSLTQRLFGDGFSSDELVDAGLAHRYPDGRMADFYRQRVLLPIRSSEERLAGLVGRNVGDPRWPKYKNPPRTVLYDKSVNLYQPLPRREHRDGRVVVVEGTIDALAIACAALQLGVAAEICPVTQSGRELSARQLDSVLSLHPGPVVAGFDGDAAGRDSNERLGLAVVARGREVIIISLPGDMDPADWLARRGPGGVVTWLLHRRRLQTGTSEIGHAVWQGGVATASGWQSTGQLAKSLEVAF
jgi:DNA primase